MNDFKNSINKKNRKLNGAVLDNYIRRLAGTKKENLDKLVKTISKFDWRIVLTKLCSFLEHNTTVDGFRNAHDVIISYGNKAIAFLEKLYQKPELRFETVECALFALYELGAVKLAKDKLRALYLTFKNDERYNLQIIIDMFELDMPLEAAAAGLEYMSAGDENRFEFVSMMLDFFESHLEVEAWLRKQNDTSCRKLISIIDDYADSFENMSVSRDNIEFFKFEDFITPDKKIPVEQIVYSYEMANLVANYITAFKEESDINFMPYNNIKGFVFILINNSIDLIQSFSSPVFPVLCDLDAEASHLFAKDSYKLRYEKLFSFFWRDMKLIYGDVIKPVNIDYFAWRTLCLTYGTLRDYLQKMPEYHINKDEDDDQFVNFIFGVSEEIAGNIEEYIQCDGSGNIFMLDEESRNYFNDLIEKARGLKN